MGFERQDLGGIWVPLVTPFRAAEPDLEVLAELMEWLLEQGISGFLALGTTGEAPHLADAEAERIVETVVRVARGRVPIMAGSGRASTRETLRMTERFAALGIDAALILTPFYYRNQMAGQALHDFYAEVAEHASVPVFVYHIPQVTGLVPEGEIPTQILRLPNVWGFKDSSPHGDLLKPSLCRQTSAFVGNPAHLQEGLEMGAAGGILAVAHVLPELCVALHRAWISGEQEQARSLQGHAVALSEALKGWAIGGIKWGLEVRSRPAGTPRRPLGTPPESSRRQIEAIIHRALEVSI